MSTSAQWDTACSAFKNAWALQNKGASVVPDEGDLGVVFSGKTLVKNFTGE
ncbi:MAG: hypothetical protein JRI22_18235 [Deltaproteobacteria bacterium]|nr:hypothetical protein [Deltaproteobacteria bacterium]